MILGFDKWVSEEGQLKARFFETINSRNTNYDVSSHRLTVGLQSVVDRSKNPGYSIETRIIYKAALRGLTKHGLQ